MSKAKAINLDEFLAGLEKSAETTFVEKLAQDAPEPTLTPEPAPEPVPETEEVKTAMEKISDAEDFGKIAAVSFWETIQKLAVSAHGYEPSAAQVPANPAVQLSNVDLPSGDANVAQVDGTLNQLTSGGRVKGPQGTIEVNGAPVAATTPQVVVDDAPIAMDATKVAAAVEAVYARIFGGM
jgi:hypothetical protein